MRIWLSIDVYKRQRVGSVFFAFARSPISVLFLDFEVVVGAIVVQDLSLIHI